MIACVADVEVARGAQPIAILAPEVDDCGRERSCCGLRIARDGNVIRANLPCSVDRAIIATGGGWRQRKRDGAGAVCGQNLLCAIGGCGAGAGGFC